MSIPPVEADGIFADSRYSMPRGVYQITPPDIYQKRKAGWFARFGQY
jgi:hypothetical protein